ncbi:protein of unknown function DUF490 [Gloeothece citriformis PCC 7424]|uniref:Translocation and assembly module TamB C-terminal domain-containing protein n=1 Tax=Gloeothece citriformis (strain PCC 7424) TaxID=65393 RepID=B7KJI7_GLOC7|nr:translocation/assembly module TamB domain-containing protein [Gloeothece citriformis]ACK73664.1 protein of unknown function DUF490 [Gloeothece citriformis PCC 7424]
MTNGSSNTPNTPPDPSEQPSFTTRLRRFIRRPSTLIGGGVLIALGVGGYLGVRYFVYERLSPLIEAQLSNFLGREVNLGEVESFSLTHIRFGNTSIPATPTDADNASVDAVNIQFNILPLLLGRPLPLEVTLVDPNVYIDQDKTGKWVDIELPEQEEELPIDLDVKVNLEDADLALKPNQLKQPVTIQADGTARYITADPQQLQYDLDVEVLKSDVNLEGKTVLDTGQTQLNLQVNRLALGEIAALLPANLINLNSGTLNADLNLNVPSLEKIEGTQGQGNVSLTQIAGRLPTLKVPIKANVELGFEGQTVLIDQFRVSLNNIVAQAKGSIDWQKGYNIQAQINPFQVTNLFKILSWSFPIDVNGQLQAKFNIRGGITQPLIIGTINNTKPINIDKLRLQNLRAGFRTNLNQLILEKAQIQPAPGGQITATGRLQLNILQALKQNKEIQWAKIPVNVNFRGALPGQPLIEPYINVPQGVTVGTINTVGQITGTFDKLQSQVNWQTPNLATVSDVQIAGSGNIFWQRDTFILRNTELQTDQGTLLVTGRVNTTTKQWQTAIEGNSFNLDPFVAIACDNFNNLCTYTNKLEPVLLETANINLTGGFDFGLDTIRGIANLDLQVQQGNVTVNSRLTQGTLNATVLASQLALDPFLTGINVPVPVQLVRTTAKISGSVEQLLNQNWNTLQADADIRLRVADDPVLISGQVQQGTLEAIVNTQQLPVSPFVPNLTVPVSIQQTQAVISAPVEELLNLNFDNLNADANVRLTIANSPARVLANINDGIINAAANLGSLALNRVFPQLPLQTTLTNAQGSLSGNLNALVTSVLEGEPDLNTITGNLNLQLAAADGTINAITQLRNNQWQARINATDINTSQLVETFAPNIEQQYRETLADANAQLRLSGLVSPIFNPDQPLPINAQNVAIQLGEQNLNATGTILVSNLLTRPDASANLSVQAQVRNLDQLPTTQLLTGIPAPQGFLPRRLDLSGDANFQGGLIAENILTAPTAPGNLQLAGNLELLDFGLNDRQFDPRLAGSVNLALGQEIALDLRGQQDIIAAVAEPCIRPDCIAPYLPVSFTFRQFTEGQPPILAQGRRVGERLLANIESFPLQVLGIAPLQEYGVPGLLQGIVSLDADVNLFTLAGRGDLLVNEPGIGNFVADSFRANFAYQDQIARLTTATLVTGESEYNLEGSLNFATGAIFARANVDDGNIEDLLAVVGTPDIETVVSFIQGDLPNLTGEADIPVYDVGAPDAPIADQVNLYARIAEYIKALAEQRQDFGVPTQLDFQGVYQASLTVGGTLQDPNVNVQFQANDWTWNPQAPYPNIIPPIGFLLQDTRTIPINEIVLEASFNDGVVAIEPARLRTQNTVFSLAGQANLLTGNLTGNFGVEDFSTDTVNNFVDVPIDLFGDLDIKGNLSGTLSNPIVSGNFAFNDLALNARLLNQTLEGNFNYSDGRFQLATTDPSFVGVYASIPYPPLAESDRVDVSLNLGNEALELINIFTNDQVSWLAGDGRVNVTATGRLGLENGVNISDLIVNGEVILANAVLSSEAFPEVVNVDGRIIFNRQLLNVQQLSATFAESEIAAAGILPFFEPLGEATNPLTVVIEQGDIDLENLYEGQIDGRVVVNGSALEPLIRGAVRLYDGRVFIPRRNGEEEQRPTPVANQWIAATTRIQQSPVTPRLDNFQVILDNLQISQEPLYQFNFGGQIAINGTLTNLNSLQPKGVIQLDRGIVNFVDTRFLIDRRAPNQIVFDPNQGILNPYLNIRLRTIVSDFPERQFQRQTGFFNNNEIPDDTLNQVRRVDITLGIDGRLSQLLPSFGQPVQEVCQIFPQMPVIPTGNVYTEQQLNQLQTCLRALATTQEANEQLLLNPIVELSSSPPLNDAEIVRLLGQQLFDIADALQGKNTAQLVEYGVVQLAFPLVFQSIAYDIENSVANALNMADFRFLPYLEAVYRVNKDEDSFVRITYDYNFNQVRVQYETRF